MPESFDEIMVIFREARVLDGQERSSYLASRCGVETELRRQIDELLASHDASHLAVVDSTGIFDDVTRELEVVPDTPAWIGPYRVIEQLGAGGMGVVFAAEQARPRRRVAVKLMNAFATPEMSRRFELEAELLGRLHHPGIAEVYEAGLAAVDGVERPFLAMALVDGTDFLEWTEGLSERDRIELVVRVAEAVEHAHRNGVIHRDLKPANILVEGDGRPVVLDFGLARAMEAEADATVLTREGAMMGTLPFMSPEQADGLGELIDTRTDVYALGVILYRVLAGELPLDLQKMSLSEAVRRIREQRPKALGAVVPSCRGDVEQIAACALEKEPKLRYQSAGAFAADLRRFLAHEPITARAPSLLYEIRRFVRRHRVASGLSLLAVTFLVLGGVATAVGLVRAQRAEARAESRRKVAEDALEDSRAVIDFLRNLVYESSSADNAGEELTFAAALDQASLRLDEELGDRPKVLAAVHLIIGLDYDRLRKSREALEHLKLSWDMRREILGEAHPDAVDSALHYGRVLRRSGNDEYAEKHIEDIIPLADALLRTEPNLATRLHYVLGETWMFRGRYAEAEERIRLALRLYAEHAVQGELYGEMCAGLAAVLRRLGRTAEGEPYLREAIATMEEYYGAESGQVASYCGNLAINLKDQGRFAEASELMRRAVSINALVFGAGSRASMAHECNLASLFLELGRHDEAIEGLTESVEVHRRHLGDDHRVVGFPTFFLARAHGQVGDLERADELLSRVQEVWNATFGPQHPRTLGARLEHARNRLARGLVDEAEVGYRFVLESDSDISASLGRKALLGLAACARERGELGKARGFLDRIEADDEGRVSAHLSYERGLCRAAEDEHAVAMTIFEVAAEAAQSLRRSSPLPALISLAWARSARRCGRDRDAAKRLQEALATAKETIGARHHLCRELERALAN